jgi:hypothetical protein
VSELRVLDRGLPTVQLRVAFSFPRTATGSDEYQSNTEFDRTSPERPMSEQLIHAARDLVGRILQKNPKRRHHCAEVAARPKHSPPRCRNRRPVP